MHQLIKQLEADYVGISFVEAEVFSWSPQDHTVYFAVDMPNGSWSLLHEVGHMLCEHNNYSSDFRLLKMEVEAWEKAREISTKYACPIDKRHINSCLDSYRNWLYQRSCCPNCEQAGIQGNDRSYTCINCKQLWKVSESKFCRVYRKTHKLEVRN